MTIIKPLLSIRGLTVQFGGLTALNSLDLAILPNQIFALVGPNGAGKTTALNCISGFVQPTAGSIEFNGINILRKGRSERVRIGVSRTFQSGQLFKSHTVLENLLIAQHAAMKADLFAGLLPFGPARNEEHRARANAMEILETLGLTAYANSYAGLLPFGAQKLTGVARALAAKPKLLLLDEPAAGVPHEDAMKLAQNLREWRNHFQVTMLLIEHNIPFVQAISEWVCALDYGEKLAEGTPQDVLKNPAVLEAYLGRETTQKEDADDTHHS